MTRERLIERLKQILPRASDVLTEELLESVLRPSLPPSDALAERLLREKCTPNEIHLALICCRNALLMIQARSSEDQDFKSMSKLLAQHDRMIFSLIKAVEEKHEQAWKLLQAELLKEGHANLLNGVITYWSQKRVVTIYNYYGEMPVTVSVKLLHVGENDFTSEMKKNELAVLLAASSDGRSAYARIPESELAIQLSVAETTQKTLHWQYGEFLPLAREKRRDDRVQSSTPVRISLKGSEQEEWDGTVMDISASGLGISCKCDIPFQVGDILAFSVILRGEQIDGKGAVCWVHGSQGYYRAGLAIEDGQKSHFQFSNEVLRRQKNLMGELRLKGIPDCLVSG